MTVTAQYYLDRLPRKVDDDGRAQSYAYDGQGQVAARPDSVDGSGTSYSTTCTYGDAGLATAMQAAAEASGTTSWTFDTGGRLATESDTNGQSASWSYYLESHSNGVELRSSQPKRHLKPPSLGGGAVP